MSLLPRDADRLQEIAAAFYGGRIDRNAGRSAVIDVVMTRIGCPRVSLWKFEGDASGEPERLLCFASKVRGADLDVGERRLERSEYRDYFNALIERGVFVSADAMAEPALQPMRDNYLVVHHVVSLLDAAFMLNARAYGMVCCEETAQVRAWRPGDAQALRAIVTRVASLMASYDDERLWNTPSLPLEPLEPEP